VLLCFKFPVLAILPAFVVTAAANVMDKAIFNYALPPDEAGEGSGRK
jgi:hypothetical protein